MRYLCLTCRTADNDDTEDGLCYCGADNFIQIEDFKDENLTAWIIHQCIKLGKTRPEMEHLLNFEREPGRKI